MGDVIRSGGSSDAYRRLSSIIAAAEAGRETAALLDLRTDEPVVDLRDPAARRLPPPPPRTTPDLTLTLVLNRVRYRLFGLAAVRSIDPQDRGLTELAALASRSTPPDRDDLVRQWFARLEIRRDARPEPRVRTRR